jgi:hypothetical protein
VKVEETSLLIRIEFADFEDYWRPFLSGDGPTGQFVTALSDEARDRLKSHLRRAYESNRPDGPRSFVAVAWACKGLFPRLHWRLALPGGGASWTDQAAQRLGRDNARGGRSCPRVPVIGTVRTMISSVDQNPGPNSAVIYTLGDATRALDSSARALFNLAVS